MKYHIKHVLLKRLTAFVLIALLEAPNLVFGAELQEASVENPVEMQEMLTDEADFEEVIEPQVTIEEEVVSEVNTGSETEVVEVQEEDPEQEVKEETTEEQEPALYYGNSIQSATSISYGSTYSSSFNDNNTVDFYKFVMSSAGRINFQASGDIYGLYWQLYDSDGQTVGNRHLCRRSDAGIVSENSDTCLNKGTYYGNPKSLVENVICL